MQHMSLGVYAVSIEDLTAVLNIAVVFRLVRIKTYGKRYTVVSFQLWIATIFLHVHQHGGCILFFPSFFKGDDVTCKSSIAMLSNDS